MGKTNLRQSFRKKLHSRNIKNISSATPHCLLPTPYFLGSKHSDSKTKMPLCPLSHIFCYPFVLTASSAENKQTNPRRAAYSLQANSPRKPESSFLVLEHPSALLGIHLRPFGSTTQYPWGSMMW